MPYQPPPLLKIPSEWRVDDLVLRLPRDQDAAAVVAAVHSHADILRQTLLPDPYLEPDADSWIRSTAEQLRDSTAVGVVVVPAADRHRVLGACGLMLDWRDRQAEVGYWFAAAARGRGVALRAVGELCRFGLDELGLPRLWLRTAATNVASRRLAERLGFRLEGVLRAAGIDGPTGSANAPRVDMCVYGLLHADC